MVYTTYKNGDLGDALFLFYPNYYQCHRLWQVLMLHVPATALCDASLLGPTWPMAEALTVLSPGTMF